MSVLVYSVIKRLFFMYFYVSFYDCKVNFDFSAVPKSAFCKAKALRGTPKVSKMSLLFSLIERHFFMHFYVPFHFLKVPFDFACLPRVAFRKTKAHRGTQKEQKCHFFSLIEWHFFSHFYVPFHFLKVSFHFAYLPKAAFCKDKTQKGTSKGGKMSLLFSLIERHVLCIFT